MYIFIIVLVLAVVLTCVARKTKCTYMGRIEDAIKMFSVTFGVISWLALFVMIAVAVCNNHIGIDANIATFEQRYESLVYQLENNLYDNDNDLGKKELYDEIRYWNEDLARRKVMQYDPWVGAFYPDIYDRFEFIELK